MFSSLLVLSNCGSLVIKLGNGGSYNSPDEVPYQSPQEYATHRVCFEVKYHLCDSLWGHPGVVKGGNSPFIYNFAKI